MTTYSEQVEKFLAEGGQIQQLDSTENRPQNSKLFCKFHRGELNQVLEALRLLGPSTMQEIAVYLSMKYIKVRSILSILREHQHITSSLDKCKMIYKVKK